jgi:hypothetical protein
LCRLGCSHGLLEILQAELQLVRVEPLRAAAELSALQLPDQEPQLLDLGLRRFTLLADEVALGTSCISLGQNSIMLSLQRCKRGILLSDDFHHPLQMLQQPIRISQKIIQNQ